MHGCAGKIVSSTKRISSWMDTTQRTGKSLLSHCAYTPFELRYDVFEMLIPLLRWDAPDAQGGYLPETCWDGKSYYANDFCNSAK